MKKILLIPLIAMFSAKLLLPDQDGQSLLDDYSNGTVVALQVIKYNKKSDNLSAKRLFVVVKRAKLNTKNFPERWRKSDGDGDYLVLDQVADVAGTKKALFKIKQTDQYFNFQAQQNSSFITARRRRSRTNMGAGNYKWEKSGATTASPFVDFDDDSPSDFTDWIMEFDEKDRSLVRLKSKKYGAYLCKPDDTKFSQGILWLAMQQDTSKDEKFIDAKKEDALLFRIQVVKTASIDDQIKRPLFPERGAGSAAGKYLVDGDEVVLLPYTLQAPILLKAIKDGLTWTGSKLKDIQDKACRFKVLKTGNWFGFRSIALNKTLHDDDDYKSIFKNNNFYDSGDNFEKWSLEPVDANNPRSLVRLRAKRSQGYLTVLPKSGNAVWTRPEKDKRPAVRDEAQLLRIIKVNEIE